LPDIGRPAALGTPAVYGLLLRVIDVMKAQNAFRKFGMVKPLTDREVAPTLRRSLRADTSANPSVRELPRVPRHRAGHLHAGRLTADRELPVVWGDRPLHPRARRAGTPP